MDVTHIPATSARGDWARRVEGCLLLAACGDAGLAEVADQVGNDTAALGSMPAALAAFLSYPDQPRAGLRFAICAGGDTDTIAAMTGALCGARGGAGVLPERWTRRLEDATHLTRLATTLARLSRGPGRPGPAGTLAGSR